VEGGAEGIYDAFRVDFGRDDVVKFVINRELFLQEPILEYRGQTIISTFLQFIPRDIWASKPFPHYMYLTAAILGVPIQFLHTGLTPSWFEICIANFGYLGFFIGVFSIPLLCFLGDIIKAIRLKAIVLMLIVALLTASIDFYFIFILILTVELVYKFILKERRVIVRA
jgi:hypothetical protein